MTEVAYRAAFDKNWERARQIFSQIVQKESRNILALGGKMWAEANLYLFDDATDDLAAIGKSNPQNGEYDRYRGMLLSIARDYDEAEKVLTEHIKAYPTDAWSYFFMAQMKETMEKNYECTSNAAKARLHAEGELKQRADLLYFRCGIKAGIGVKEALAELEKLEAESPNDISIQLEHIEALINSKKLADAVSVARAYVEKSPRSYDLRVKLGDVYVLRGDFDRAVAFYNSAVASRPRSAEAFTKIAKVLDELKRLPEAAQNYEAAAQAQPSYPEVYLQAARAYVKLRNPPKAADMYVRELKARPSSVTTFMEAAEFFLIVKAPQEVPRIYAMVAEGFQQDPGVLVRLAQAYLGLQDYEKARLNAANAAAGAPKMPEAQRILGESFEALGNYEAARSHYELYLRLLPEAPDGDDLRRKLSGPPFSN
jgi:tetratricopeptide (TPR) repeat protein